MSVVFWRQQRRDFSYFETFWSEFKPENGQLAQNKADSKLTPAVFQTVVYCICYIFVFVFVLYLNCILMVKTVFVSVASLHRRFPILSSQFQGWTLVSRLGFIIFLGISMMFIWLYLYFTWIVFLSTMIKHILLDFGQLTRLQPKSSSPSSIFVWYLYFSWIIFVSNNMPII